MKKAKHKQSSEKKHEAHNAKHEGKSTCCSGSSWMIVSIVLAVLLVISVVMMFTGNKDALVALSEGEAEEKAEEFVGIISNPQTPLTVESVEEVDGLYALNIEVQGEQVTYFMSLDGEYLFPSAVTVDELTEMMEGQQDQQQDQQPPQADSAGDVDVNLEGANTLGSGDLVMVEYSSSTCPYCAKYFTETFPEITQEYIDSNEITYVYKHFTRGDVDVTAGNAMECAGEQDKFFEYKELVYNNQQALSQESSYVDWAEELDLDVDAFSTCFDERRYTEKIADDTEEGQSNGITGTPGFLIGSKVLAGAQPFEAFKSTIDGELAN